MKQTEHIYKLHNKTLLLYHLVFSVKYQKKIIDEDISKTIRKVCLEIELLYKINFVEIGTDENHVHFLIQGIPRMSVTKIVTTIKSITAREIFSTHKGIKKNSVRR